MIFASCHIDYRSPGNFDEDVDVRVRPAEIGTLSLKLEFEMRVGERLLAEGYGVLVGYDYANQKSTELPEALCAKLRTMCKNATDCSSSSPAPTAPGPATTPTSWPPTSRAMNTAALDVFRAGHLPVTGEALALPLIERRGQRARRRPGLRRDLPPDRPPAPRALRRRAADRRRLGRAPTRWSRSRATHGKPRLAGVAELP